MIRLNPEEDDAIAAALACLMAGVRVLAFAHDVSQVSLYEAGRPVRTLTDLSPGELISALARV